MEKDTSFLYKRNKSSIMILKDEKLVVLSRKILSSDGTTGKTMFFSLRVNFKYFAFSFRSEGEPYLSLISFAQPPNSSLISFGHSTFLSLVCNECLKL